MNRVFELEAALIGIGVNVNPGEVRIVLRWCGFADTGGAQQFVDDRLLAGRQFCLQALKAAEH